MGLFTKVKILNIYSALYTYNDMQEYYPITEYICENEEELDNFAAEIMKEQGLPEPYHRISLHLIGHEKRRIRK